MNYLTYAVIFIMGTIAESAVKDFDHRGFVLGAIGAVVAFMFAMVDLYFDLRRKNPVCKRRTP